jgi:hypothetical protein
MRFKIYPMRAEGRPLPMAQVLAGPSYTGEMRCHTYLRKGSDDEVISLICGGNGIQPDLLPELHQPYLVWFHESAIQLRGFERIDDHSGFRSVIQEWWCTGW